MLSQALKQRILTALVLVPLVVGSVIWLETVYFSLVLAIVVFVGSLEWAQLAGVASCSARIAYMVLVAVGLWLSAYLVQMGWGDLWVLVVVIGWWLLVSIRLLGYRPRAVEQGLSTPLLGAGLMVLVPGWLALVRLHGQGQQGPEMVMFLLVLVWAADSGAYFAGRRWGRVKLAPHISPGKTREGVLGGLAAVLLCAVGFSLLQRFDAGATLLFLGLCLVTAVFSVVGDLFESLVKRRRGVKDSGQLLPGHGGVLDRIDSLTAAAPVFALGLQLIGVGH